MTNQNAVIHIVSLDVPFPANYGAMIDIYHRCKTLKEIGVKVILHCFDYGRGKPEELKLVCEEVHFYSRNNSPLQILNPLPFIVKSRMNPALLKRLLKDDYPILFEGIHTCGFVGHPKLSNRWIGVRAHNIEHDYYEGLAAIEPKKWKKWFFQLEAKKLKRFENSCFPLLDEILSVSLADNEYFTKTYQKGSYIPVFNPLHWGVGLRGRGDYLLMHGNLSVIENIKGIEFVLNEVWTKEKPFKIVIAGKDPDEAFKKYIAEHPAEIELIINPDDDTLNQLIRKAKINALPTFQATGLKHKLLNALSNGGFCLATPEMVHGTQLGKWCIVKGNAQQWQEAILSLWNTNIMDEEIEERLEHLRQEFDNKENASKIMKLVERKTFGI